MGQSITSLSPAGVIKPYAAGALPSGFLQCDGSAVSRTTYAILFAVVGTTYGAGNGTTTFNLPDLRGRMPMGDGTGSGLTARTVGQLPGGETHTLGGTNLPSHTHGVSGNTGGGSISGTANSGVNLNHTHVQNYVPNGGGGVVAGGTSVYAGNNSPTNTNIPTQGSGTLDHSHSVSGSASSQSFSATSDGGPGSAVAVNHVNPTLVVRYIIKY